MSSTASIQSGRLDVPNPGCDGAISRWRSDSGSDVRVFRREALRAVQEQDRRAFAGLVHLKLTPAIAMTCRCNGTAS